MEQQIFMLDIIKSDKIQYIPFKIIFAEGTVSMDAEPTTLKMQPVWLSVGELNNVLFYIQADRGYLDENTFNLQKYVKCLYSKKTIIPPKQSYYNIHIGMKQKKESKSTEELRLESESIIHFHTDIQIIEGLFDEKGSFWDIGKKEKHFPIYTMTDDTKEHDTNPMHITQQKESVSPEELRVALDYGHTVQSNFGEYTLIDLSDEKQQNQQFMWGNQPAVKMDNYPTLIYIEQEYEDFDLKEMEEIETKTQQITATIDSNNDELLYEKSNVCVWRWDTKQYKWRWRGRGYICIYHNKLKLISRIIFKDNNHDKIRLLQYIDGNIKCNTSGNSWKNGDDTFIWFGYDYSMNQCEPINATWKLKVSERENYSDGFRKVFNKEIDAFNSYYMELLFEHNFVTISKWDTMQNKWLNKDKHGTICIYYNKEKCISKIIFVNNSNELRLLQYIDGKTFCKFRIDDMGNNNDLNEISSIVEWISSDHILYSMQILCKNRWSQNDQKNQMIAQQFLNIFNEQINIFNGNAKNKQYTSSLTMADLIKLIIPKAFDLDDGEKTIDDILVDTKNHDDNEKYNKLNYVDKRCIYYINTETNKMVLNERYFNEIREEIDFLRLTQYVSKNINHLSKHYRFNQINKSFSGYLCNENVYGNLNLIECTGFIHIPLKQIDHFIINSLANILTDYVCDESVSQIIISYIPLTHYPDYGTNQFIFRPFKQCDEIGIKTYYQHICIGAVNLEKVNKSTDELRFEDQYDDDIHTIYVCNIKREISGKFNNQSIIWKFGKNDDILTEQNIYNRWYKRNKKENKDIDML